MGIEASSSAIDPRAWLAGGVLLREKQVIGHVWRALAVRARHERDKVLEGWDSGDSGLGGVHWTAGHGSLMKYLNACCSSARRQVCFMPTSPALI